MRHTPSVNAFLLLVLAALVALNWGLQQNREERGLDFMPEMMQAVPAEAFSSNSVLPAGMTLQTPPVGTIPRGWPPLHLEATPEDARRAGEELENPFFADDPEATARGQLIFSRYCVLCHGPVGLGDGTVSQGGFPAPPSLLAANALEMKDGQIFHIITFGQGNMPAHAAQLERADRWRAVLYVRTLQSKAAPVSVTAPALAADSVASKTAPVGTASNEAVPPEATLSEATLEEFGSTHDGAAP